MSIDLLGLVSDQLNPSAIGKISNFLGESQQNTQKAATAISSTLLGGLMEKASSTEGVTSVLDLLKEGNHDGSLLNNIANIIDSNEGVSGLLSGGSKISSDLLGEKINSIVDTISNLTGIKKSSSSSLISLAAPIVMEVLGKQVSSQGMGISGLANLLLSQKEQVKASLPQGIESLMNINMDGLSDFLGLKKNEASNDEDDTSLEGGFNFWPWLIGAGLLLGSWYFIRGCNKTSDITEINNSISNDKDEDTDSLSQVESMVYDSMAAAMSKSKEMLTKKLSSGFEIKGSNSGVESQLIAFIEDDKKGIDKNTWFNFDKLRFDNGKATISQESQEQITNIAEILKAFPKVNLKIGGYTDNVGKEATNLKLSADRAAAVVVALKAEGIDGKRLNSEGYGPKFAQASNDTEEGRAKNRRIALRVTAK